MIQIYYFEAQIYDAIIITGNGNVKEIRRQ